MTSWISVEDELPKEDGKYLVHYLNRVFFSDGRPQKNILTTATFYTGVFLVDGYGEEPAVTHWMPLPDPPEDK